MNTEFNKNRILTQGWKNVLRNITPFCNKNYSVNNQSTPESNEKEEKVVKDEKMEYGKDDSMTVPTQKQSNFELTSITNTTDSNKNILNETLQPEVDQQSCSGTTKENKGNSAEKMFKRQNNETSVIQVRTKLIFELLSRIDDEDRYISTFMKFVELEERITAGKSLENLDYTVDEHRPKILPHFVGNVRRKFKKRNAILQKLQCCVNEIDIYEERL